MTIDLRAVQVTLLLAVLVISLMNAFLVFELRAMTSPQEEAAAIILPLGDDDGLTALIIDLPCDSCVNLSELVDFLDEQVVPISSREIKSPSDASDIVTALNITRFPALVLTGESDALGQIESFEKTDNGFVFKSATPFVDESGIVHGLVDVTILRDASCLACQDASLFASSLEAYGMVLGEPMMVERESDEGKSLIDRYAIETLPTLVLSADAVEYSFMTELWESVGSIEDDGVFVLRQVPPPFVNLSSGSVSGLVDLTLLVDESCTACSSALDLRTFLSNAFGLVLDEERDVTTRSAEGQALVESLNITRAPVIILSEEASAYPALVDAWDHIGSIESDGSFVLRSQVPGVLTQEIR